MTIREITLICWAVASYIYLGYCWVSILKRLGWARKDIHPLAYIVTVLLWPVGLMLFEARLIEEDYDDND
ncbi:TPA: hypothetical protein U5E00_002353 [Yersinia enterocolitica]|uniref:hypothetical protein n=2 Tax=Yersiniaceae TaxID=1903411 RepID=UPI0005E8BD96|nr:hypothetical protein [Yersinia enterocolitica]EKN3386834.1 hypothetical protein [Yersinia enterocolitica]EKN3766475.1 hypothetical protein [Yersinia enterocolitica]EKN4083124.1 hypothetical protein [Yersinia enterocolitica]EKN6162482.1 hypothetical protein [Yersinia enterocolitica]ELI8281383.1 hypothetical protein [Yersinia enterocolitica]